MTFFKTLGNDLARGLMQRIRFAIWGGIGLVAALILALILVA